MSTMLANLGLDRMSRNDLWQLVGEICDTLEAEGATPPLTEGQAAELDRRCAALDAHPSKVTPWEVVEAEVLERLRR